MQRKVGNVKPQSGKYVSATAKEKTPLMSNSANNQNPVSAILLSQPFYGGTQPGSTVPAAQTPPIQPPPTPEQQPQPTPQATPEATPEDPLAKLAADPQALSQLLAQVDSLQKELKGAQEKVSGFEDEKAKAERAQQTREQQLEADLAQRDAVIQQMDVVIKNMAINNAMMSQPDLKWNSVKQAVAELDPSGFDIDVNLERGEAQVTGIDKECQRIAKDFPWLVSKGEEKKPDPSPRSTQTPRKATQPPAPPGGDTDKATKRNRLMKKYPVLTAGQPV